MTSLSFETAVQTNEVKLSCFVQFENERNGVILYSITAQNTDSYVLTVLVQSDFIASTVFR